MKVLGIKSVSIIPTVVFSLMGYRHPVLVVTLPTGAIRSQLENQRSSTPPDPSSFLYQPHPSSRNTTIPSPTKGRLYLHNDTKYVHTRSTYSRDLYSRGWCTPTGRIIHYIVYSGHITVQDWLMIVLVFLNFVLQNVISTTMCETWEQIKNLSHKYLVVVYVSLR